MTVQVLYMINSRGLCLFELPAAEVSKSRIFVLELMVDANK